MPPKENYSLTLYISPFTLLPSIVIAVMTVLACFALYHINRANFKYNDTAERYVNTSALMQCLANGPNKQLTTDEVKSCVEGAKGTQQMFDEVVKPRIEELKWLLTMIGALAGFSVIAQAAATWFSAEAYTKKAEDGLKAISNVQEDIAKVHDAVKARYPLFERVEKQRNDAYAALDDLFKASSKTKAPNAKYTEALDFQDNLFKKLRLADRQQLLSVESFASIDLDPGSLTEEGHADMLRNLALFYRAKFLYENRLVTGSFADLERAEGYLLAANRMKRDFTLKNDLASVYNSMYFSLEPDAAADKETYWRKNEDALKDSLAIEPEQQRAHNGLAVVLSERSQYADAIAQIKEGLKYKLWQRQESDYFTGQMWYNMGCYESQLLQEKAQRGIKVTVADAKAVIDALEESAKRRGMRPEVVKRDFEDPQTGDFKGLLTIADQTLTDKMAELRASLNTAFEK